MIFPEGTRSPDDMNPDFLKEELFSWLLMPMCLFCLSSLMVPGTSFPNMDLFSEENIQSQFRFLILFHLLLLEPPAQKSWH